MTGVKFLQFREFIRFISSQVKQVIHWVITAGVASAPKTVTTTKVQETVPRVTRAPGGTTRVTPQTWTVVTMAATTPPMLTASIGTTGKDTTTQPNRPTWKSSRLNRIKQTKSVKVKERLLCSAILSFRFLVPWTVGWWWSVLFRGEAFCFLSPLLNYIPSCTGWPGIKQSFFR